MEHLPIISSINTNYKAFLHSSGFFFLLAFLITGMVGYCAYIIYLFRKNRHKKLYFLTLQFPEINEDEENRYIEKMQSIFSSIHRSISTNTDKIFFEIYKVDEYITFQVGSNKKEILDQLQRLFSQLGSVQVRTTKDDVLEQIEPLHAKRVSMVKDYYTISKDKHFFTALVHMLASSKEDEQAGVQIILRGVNKRGSIQGKIHKLIMKARKYKRPLYESEQMLLQMYQAKQKENIYKVKIHVVGNSTLLTENIGAAFQSLNYENNTFSTRSEKKEVSRTRYIGPETLLSYIPTLLTRSESYLTVSELSYLFHPTSATRGIYAPKQTKHIESSPEFTGQSDHNILIGTSEDHEGKRKDVYFPLKNFARHIYVIGKTGRGKSTFLTTLISHLGKGEKASTFVFDPHGDLLEDIAQTVDNTNDLVYLNTNNTDKVFTVNPLFAFGKDDNEKAALQEGLLDIIQNETQEQGGVATTGAATISRIKQMLSIGIDFADAYYNYLVTKRKLTPERAAVLVNERQLTLNDLPSLLLKEMDYIDVLQEIFKDQETPTGIYIAKLFEGHTKQNMVAEAVQTRLEQLLHPSLRLVYEGNKLNMQETIEIDKTFLIPIQETTFGSRGSRGLTQTLFLLIWLYKRQKTADRKETYVFIDEFQKAQISAIPEIIAEGRKYKLFLTLSNQQLGQLKDVIKDAIFGNIGTLASFTVAADVIGAKTLAPYFGNGITEKDLTQLPPYMAYMRTEGSGKKPLATFSFETIQNATKGNVNTEAISKKSLDQYGETITELKRKLHAKQVNPMGYFLDGV